jgi:hypothetical protein
MSHWKVFLLFLTALPWSAEPFASTSPSPTTTKDAHATRRRRLGRRSNKPSSSRCLSLPPLTRTPAITALYDVLRDGEAHQNGGTSTKMSRSAGPRWHRRIWSKLLRRDSSPASPLHMTVMMDEETEILLESIDAIYQQHQLNKNQEFIMHNFDLLTPDMVLPEVSVPIDDDKTFDRLDSEFYGVTLTPASNTSSVGSTEHGNTDDSSSSRKGISLPRLLGMLFENILTSRILRAASNDPEDMLIQVEPLENTVGRLFRGQFLADVELSAKKIIFPRIRFSSINIELEQVTLNLLGFLQQPQTEQQSNPAIRYPKQFDLHVRDLTMSHHDLHHSACVGNGLRMLLINILKNRGIESSSIQITSMDILVRKCTSDDVAVEFFLGESYSQFCSTCQSIYISHVSTFRSSCCSQMERYLARERRRHYLAPPRYPSRSEQGYHSPIGAMFLHSLVLKSL